MWILPQSAASQYRPMVTRKRMSTSCAWMHRAPSVLPVGGFRSRADRRRACASILPHHPLPMQRIARTGQRRGVRRESLRLAFAAVPMHTTGAEILHVYYSSQALIYSSSSSSPSSNCSSSEKWGVQRREFLIRNRVAGPRIVLNQIRFALADPQKICSQPLFVNPLFVS